MFSSNQFFSVVYFLFRKSQWTQVFRRRRGALTFFNIGFFLAKDQETNRISLVASSMCISRTFRKEMQKDGILQNRTPFHILVNLKYKTIASTDSVGSKKGMANDVSPLQQTLE